MDEEQKSKWMQNMAIFVGVALVLIYLWRQYKSYKEEIAAIKEITECHHVTGQCDFLLKAYVKDIKSYERLIMDKISKISVVKTFQTMMIMSTNKKEPAVPLEY